MIMHHVEILIGIAMRWSLLGYQTVCAGVGVRRGQKNKKQIEAFWQGLVLLEAPNCSQTVSYISKMGSADDENIEK